MPCRLAFDQELMIVLKSLRIQNFIFVLAVVALTVGACGDGGVGLSESGEIGFDYQQEPDPVSGAIELASGSVSVGQTDSYTVSILNTGTGMLNISDVSLEYSAPEIGVGEVLVSLEEVDGSAFSLYKGFITDWKWYPQTEKWKTW